MPKKSKLTKRLTPMSRLIPKIGLCTIHATVNVIRYNIDPITRANMTAAKLIILARNQPMSGMNLKRAIIGEKRRKVPKVKRIQDPKRKRVEIMALSLFSS